MGSGDGCSEQIPQIGGHTTRWIMPSQNILTKKHRLKQCLNASIHISAHQSARTGTGLIVTCSAF